MSGRPIDSGGIDIPDQDAFEFFEGHISISEGPAKVFVYEKGGVKERKKVLCGLA